MAKVMGGGLPAGAVGASAHIMDVIQSLPAENIPGEGSAATENLPRVGRAPTVPMGGTYAGYKLGDGMIQREPRYGFGAWFALLFGISIEPSRIDFRCRKCGKVVYKLEDPDVLKTET